MPERAVREGRGRTGSGSGTRTRDTAIMSRLLYRLSYPATCPATGVTGRINAPTGTVVPPVRGGTGDEERAPMRIRTADLLLTMETLYLLSYRGAGPTSEAPALRGRHRQTKIHGPALHRRTGSSRSDDGTPRFVGAPLVTCPRVSQRQTASCAYNPASGPVARCGLRRQCLDGHLDGTWMDRHLITGAKCGDCGFVGADGDGLGQGGAGLRRAVARERPRLDRRPEDEPEVVIVLDERLVGQVRERRFVRAVLVTSD